MNTEDNQVNMVGVLPSNEAGPIPVGKIPDDGTQVSKSNSADNSTEIIHTVTASTTFYLVGWTLSALNESGGSLAGSLLVRNDADVLQYGIAVLHLPDNGYDIVANSYTTPIEIAAGWDICVYSPGADYDIWGHIFGYEV